MKPQEKVETEVSSDLKKSILAFRNQYKQALQTATLKNNKISGLEKEIEELREDNQALVSQQNLLKEMLKRHQKEVQKHPVVKTELNPLEADLKNAREECQLQQQRIDKLSRAVQEREQRIAALQRYEFSFKKVSEINQQYEKDFAAQKAALSELKAKEILLENEKNKVIEHNAQMERALEHLRGKYEEAKLEVKTLEHDFQKAQTQLEEMKTTLVRGLKEAKDIKNYYQNIAHEKSLMVQKIAYMQEQNRESHEELKKRDALIAQLNDALARVQGENEVLNSKNGENQHAVHALSEQLKDVQAKLKLAEETIADKEKAMIEVQQQFAKRMREISRLQDLHEEQKGEISQLQTDLVASRAKTGEVQALLESKSEQLKMVQNQIVVADQKYSKLQEKLVELEADNRELKKIEEKHRQTQQLLAGLGNVFGSPMTYAVEEPKKSPQSAPIAPAPKETSLFERQEPTHKPKQNLFE